MDGVGVAGTVDPSLNVVNMSSAFVVISKTEVGWARGGCDISPYKAIVDNLEFECGYRGLMGAREIRPYITVDFPSP